MIECCIHSASTLWDLPTTVLARFFELCADVIAEGDTDIWEHFTSRQLAHIFSQIAASQAHPPKTGRRSDGCSDRYAPESRPAVARLTAFPLTSTAGLLFSGSATTLTGNRFDIVEALAQTFESHRVGYRQAPLDDMHDNLGNLTFG